MKKLIAGTSLVAVLLIVYFSRSKKEEPVSQQLSEESSNDESYLWLEKVEGKEALEWVESQNARSLEELRSYKDYESFKQKALEELNDPDRLPGVGIRGDYVYNFWQDENAVRGLWRRMLWSDYIEGKEDWDTILDLDALSAKDGKTWVWKGSTCLRPNYELCLLSLSDGGKDAVLVREFDVAKKQFVEGGYQVEEAKTSVSWLDSDRLLVTTNLFEDFRNESGYGFKVQLWERGKDLKDAPVVFSGSKEDVFVRGFPVYDGDEQYVFFSKSESFFTNEFFYFDGKNSKPLNLPTHARFQGILGGQLLFSLRQDDLGFQSGDVLAIAFESQLSDQEKTYQLVFRSTENQSEASLVKYANGLLVSYLEDVRGKLERMMPEETVDGEIEWRREKIQAEGQASLGLMSADEDSERLLIVKEDFLTPPSILTLDSDLKLKTLKAQKPRFDAEGLVVEQSFAASKDGTKVPYFLIYNPEKLKPSASPTLLYGYGGFQISLSPRYLGLRGSLWLENGGVYAVANIRGGGEYGPRWHNAARLENRQRAFDDFISVAEDLIAREITSPKHLGIQGGSNGGLLVGTVMTQRPELFNAVICQVPLLDMLRYHLLPAGASWVGEYGDPEDPAMAEVLASYSPFHNLSKSRQYPEVFFVTSTKDDRVHPGHARKMAKRMQDYGFSYYYYENTQGGHSASADLEQRAENTALSYSYLWKKLSPAMSH